MTLTRRTLLARTVLALGATVPARFALGQTAWPTALVMGTGRAGGSFPLYAQGWGELAQAQSGTHIAYRATDGAAANLLLIEENAVQLGLTSTAVAHEARFGTAAWTSGVKFHAFRALFPIFRAILQIVARRDSGIATLAALAGQRLGIGPAGGGGAATIPAVLASLGVYPRQAATGGYMEQINAMLAGQLDACAFIGAPPMPAIAGAALGRKLSLIGLSAAEAAQAARVLPGMSPMVLKAGTFPGQTIAVQSVGTVALAVASASLPEQLAEQLTRAALDHRAALSRFVPAAASPPSLKPLLAAGLTFHPGAARALRAHGFSLPRKAVEG